MLLLWIFFFNDVALKCCTSQSNARKVDFDHVHLDLLNLTPLLACVF